MTNKFDPEKWLDDAIEAGLTVILQIHADGSEQLCIDLRGDQDDELLKRLRPSPEAVEENQHILAGHMRRYGPFCRVRRAS